MPVDPKVMQEMEAAANEAAKEIPQLKEAQDVAKWLKKWYLKAGYKRLNRILMQYYGV